MPDITKCPDGYPMGYIPAEMSEFGLQIEALSEEYGLSIAPFKSQQNGQWNWK